MTKNSQKHQKTRKIAMCQKWGSPKWPPGAPKKKASLSNRRIGTRNTDSHMVSIQKGQKSTPDFRGCARPPKKGRIKAKLKFFFELFQKTSKIAFLTLNLAFPRPFLAFFCLFRPFHQNRHFEPFSAHFDHFSRIPYIYLVLPFFINFS